jgi:hypothetical protein
MAKISAGLGEWKGKFVVRDKDGNVKLDKPEHAAHFWDVLSEKDKDYLIEKFDLKLEK